ncbi:PREDICTED: uncharacterized protein LOC108368880 [Rhagoletis zephyria]|uniref:uncharacterized protein LOC108368880 n=1 Tax=Rhagoletis zephyria TaxID=28612 RepID=UPI00081145B0|nr:PREDICTED: uncharacterized protein LOC108368880 [Rhagoletis zephyria]
MASEGVDDWDEPLPSSSTIEPEEEEMLEDKKEEHENMVKLKTYVARMAYKPSPPLSVRPRTDRIAATQKRHIVDSYVGYGKVLTPKERRQRVKRLARKYNAISTEQLEQIIKNQKCKERKLEDLHKRKQELYYEMLTKLERQCRTQYLNVLIKKFSNFIAKLATTMQIPPQLVEPYSRMQRGIFCNILLAIGVQPTNQNAIYYTTPEAMEYEVCHKLAHALLSLIIKALDSASTKHPDEIVPQEGDFEMDRYIKDRLMCAAEKKILNTRNQAHQTKLNRSNALALMLRRCENCSVKNCV